MKKICLSLAICTAITFSSAAADSPQQLLNSIDDTIQKSVGAKWDNQIPGGLYGDDHSTVETSGIECPKEITTVKQAIELAKTKLTSAFGNRITKIRSSPFSTGGGDTVVTVYLQDKTQEVTISISIFKRSSSVFLFSTLISKSPE